MATYTELHALSSNVALLQRVMTAVAIAGEAIRTEDPATTNHDRRMAWARRGLENPDGTARQLMWVLLAQNATLTAAQIEGASDAAVQATVNSALELLV